MNETRVQEIRKWSDEQREEAIAKLWPYSGTIKIFPEGKDAFFAYLRTAGNIWGRAVDLQCELSAAERDRDAAMELLRRASDLLDDVPCKDDPTFWGDFYAHTGEHMICTEEGWRPGDVKQSIIDDYGPEAILAEVNDPARLAAQEVK